jgi:hypothetical protein
MYESKIKTPNPINAKTIIDDVTSALPIGPLHDDPADIPIDKQMHIATKKHM